MIGAPEIIAAIIGATSTGAFTLIDRIRTRKRRAESVLTALAAEVRSILDLIEHQRYAEAIREQAALVRAGSWGGRSYIIDVRSDYFSVYNSLTAELGLLQPDQVQKVVAFYAYCKSAIDSTRPDGPFADGVDQHEALEYFQSLEGLFAAIKMVGEHIITMPKHPIAPALTA